MLDRSPENTQVRASRCRIRRDLSKQVKSWLPSIGEPSDLDSERSNTPISLRRHEGSSFPFATAPNQRSVRFSFYPFNIFHTAKSDSVAVAGIISGLPMKEMDHCEVVATTPAPGKPGPISANNSPRQSLPPPSTSISLSQSIDREVKRHATNERYILIHRMNF